MYNLCTLCYISNIHLVCFTGLLCYSILMLSLVCAFVRCCEFWFHLKQLTFSRFPFEMMYRQVFNLESRYFFLKILGSSYRSLLTSGTAKVWGCVGFHGQLWKSNLHLLCSCCKKCIPDWELGSSWWPLNTLQDGNLVSLPPNCIQFSWQERA